MTKVREETYVTKAMKEAGSAAYYRDAFHPDGEPPIDGDDVERIYLAMQKARELEDRSDRDEGVSRA
jgi:hypothetical protein